MDPELPPWSALAGSVADLLDLAESHEDFVLRRTETHWRLGVRQVSAVEEDSVRSLTGQDVTLEREVEEVVFLAESFHLAGLPRARP